jgi:hypothetical protein
MNVIFCSGIHSIIDFHNSCLISAPVAIIGRRKNSDNGPIVLPLIPFHYQLMSTGNEIKPIYMSKLFRDINSKGIASTPRRNTPTTPEGISESIRIWLVH